MAQQKYEDMIMKHVMASFAQSGLRFLGITDEVVQPAETELVVLELQKYDDGLYVPHERRKLSPSGISVNG